MPCVANPPGSIPALEASGRAAAPSGAAVIRAASRELLLLPQRAALDTASRSLMVADLHVGKAGTFRAHGLPVPAGTTERTLARLDALLALTGARALFLLGDLVHGPLAGQPATVAALAAWRARHRRVEVVLVRGNHDQRAGELPAECGIETVAPGYRLGGLRLLHEPPDDSPAFEGGAGPGPSGEARADCGAGDPDLFSLAGHLHPVCVVGGRADRLRLPCFRVGRRDAVLPAFGEFTGGWPVRPRAGERIFVTDGSRVAELPARPARRRA